MNTMHDSDDDQAEPVPPNLLHSRQVEAMAGYGIPAEDIATVLGVGRLELERDYRKELDGAAIKANAKVAESLFRKATGEGREGVVAAIFWLKTRAGWKETSVHEFSGQYPKPISQLSPEELDARLKAVMRRLEESNPGFAARLFAASGAEPGQ